MYSAYDVTTTPRVRATSDGRMVVSIRFRMKSESAGAPMVVQTFRLYTPEDFTVKSGTHALIPISCVREDTYEPISISQEDFESALESAVTTVADFDPDW